LPIPSVGGPPPHRGEEPPVDTPRTDKARDALYRHAADDLLTGEKVIGSFPFAAVPRRPKSPGESRKEKVLTGIRQSLKRYRPVLCTDRRVLVYDAGKLFHPRGLLATFPAAEVEVVELRRGSFGGRVLVLALPGEGDVPFELGRKDLPDLTAVLAALGPDGPTPSR
jgi:hypothetical protein